MAPKGSPKPSAKTGTSPTAKGTSSSGSPTGYRVGLDAHYLATAEGNRSYVHGLLTGLGRIAWPPGLEVVAYAYETGDLDGYRVERRTLPRSPLLRVPLAIPLAQRRDGLALWHGSWVAPPWSFCPLVLTIHDVLFATHPELFGARQGARLRVSVGQAVRRAERILVPTAATRSALLSAYPFVDPQRVRLVPLGIDHSVFHPDPSEEDAQRRRALGIQPPYVLSVGRPHPRKNLATLMAALATLPELTLVLAGPHHRAGAQLLQLARTAGLDPKRLFVLSGAGDTDLSALYRGCGAFCYPSLGEGFGLPALEALACGAPTVISQDPALREVCGAAATAVPARDHQALANAIQEACGDATRARAEGPARAAEFTLEAMARGTLAVYADVLGCA